MCYVCVVHGVCDGVYRCRSKYTHMVYTVCINCTHVDIRGYMLLLPLLLAYSLFTTSRPVEVERTGFWWVKVSNENFPW